LAYALLFAMPNFAEIDPYDPFAVLCSMWLIAALGKECEFAFKLGFSSALLYLKNPMNKMQCISLLLPAIAFVPVFGFQLPETLCLTCVFNVSTDVMGEEEPHGSISTARNVMVVGGGALLVATVGMRMLLLNRHLGPLVLNAFKMLRDVREWAFLVSIFILSFGLALNNTRFTESSALARRSLHGTTGSPGVTPECEAAIGEYGEGVLQSAWALVRVTFDVGTTDLSCFSTGPNPVSGTFLMFSFQLIVVILYLNMLIGIMGNTLAHVDDDIRQCQSIFSGLVLRYTNQSSSPAFLIPLRWGFVLIKAVLRQGSGQEEAFANNVNAFADNIEKYLNLYQMIRRCCGYYEILEDASNEETRKAKKKAKRVEEERARGALLNLAELKKKVKHEIEEQSLDCVEKKLAARIGAVENTVEEKMGTVEKKIDSLEKKIVTLLEKKFDTRTLKPPAPLPAPNSVKD